MRAKQRAGRPKQQRAKIDRGTLELRQKRQADITEEALDLAFKRALIDEKEHEAAMRLRWLYHLRFGSPNVKAYDPDGKFSSGGIAQQKDDAWYGKRKQEYEEAVALLSDMGARNVVMWVAVFDKKPLCLRYTMRQLAYHQGFYDKAQKEVTCLKEGLLALVRYFSEGSKRTQIHAVHAGSV